MVLKKKHKVISLFSGAGGLELGACQTGFVSDIFSTDRNEKFYSTLSNNMSNHFKNINHSGIVMDAKELSGKFLLENANFTPSLVMGGPPCDDFTTTGRRRGEQGDKGGLIFEFLRLVKEIDSDCFIFENVPNLAKQFKNYFDKFLNEFQKKGYFIKWKLLKASDFGSPTQRSRIFVIGFKSEVLCKNFYFPEPTHFSEDDTDLFSGSNTKNKYNYISDVLSDIPDVNTPESKKILNHQGRQHKPETVEHLKTVPQGKSVKKSYRYRAPWHGLCRSLTAGTDDSTKAYIHPIYHREMSVREYARIHGFPDDWFFHGNLHNGIKQVANAVPVPLAKAVLDQVLNHIILN